MAIPLITAAVLLILNLFVFYLNILATGVKGHKDACRLEIRSYEFNEDLLVRAKEVLHEE